MKRDFKYLQQNSELTLRQGVEEYTAGYEHLNKNDGESEASRWFFCHDCTHVIFGTIPFQLRGESINDVLTLCGTDMTIKKYLKFFEFVDYDVVLKSYVKRYKSKFKVYLKLASLIPICVVAINRGLRMKKKWQWFEPEQYLDIPLWKVRQDFGIKVIGPYK
ncbi:hypothetical protein JQC92_21490 [Shewanella sp. 202IG2-18]|uniref:hypothetical protein n=1 Tax=Parashewanella hymeniacidonis TaxID=2807618 RepID=UPI0019610D85|nr:hypothetical protein [Parashewanella hymeniacidonis]MBM7074558.1 hypothetical protein [Parashewanella hymeniacidonis]